MDDYLAAEPLIVARLEDQIPEVSVKSTWGMPRIQENFDLAPAILVFLEEDRPGQDSGISQKVEQVWLCLVVVNNAEKEAGPLIGRVIKAMSGWRPVGNMFSTFKRVKSHFNPDYSPNGVYYFPLAFSTNFVFTV
ncbi:MAG: hypothetical protein HQL84_18875 [Magnetococcales bacterium]|nr:hypothetical protein [Magnetococcales bacterium]MBF0152084.1 hypothetical protein [Magnetococcales bacterium]